MNPCKNNISFDDKVLQKLWIPNTCFINSKTAAIHESPFKLNLQNIIANFSRNVLVVQECVLDDLFKLDGVDKLQDEVDRAMWHEFKKAS